MTNGEQPINPITESEKDRLDTYPDISYTGLTKREYFAALAMQGLLSNNLIINITNSVLVANAVGYADLLLKELDK